MNKIALPTISSDAGMFWARYNKLAIKDFPIVLKTGIHFSTLSTWRSKKKYPRADDACKIAEALNTTVEYLVTGKEAADTNCSPAALEIAVIADKLVEKEMDILKSVAASLELNHTIKN